MRYKKTGCALVLTASIIALGACSFSEILAPTHVLTVASGTGAGSYAAGTEVTVTADAPPQGSTFDRWAGDTGELASLFESTTTLTMPTGDVTITATYAGAPKICPRVGKTRGPRTGDWLAPTGPLSDVDLGSILEYARVRCRHPGLEGENRRRSE